MDKFTQRVEAIRSFMERQKLSNTKMGDKAGISPATVSQIMNLKYTGDWEVNLAKMELVVESFREKENLGFSEPQYVETSVYRKIHYALEKALNEVVPKIEALYGESGIGKTYALKKFREEYSTMVLIEIRPDFNLKAVLSRLADSLQVSKEGANYEVTDRIIAKLQSVPRLLVFDEAEYLNQRSLDMIRRIFDESRCPIRLIGLPKLFKNISDTKEKMAQIANRMTSFKIESPSDEDLEALAKSAYPEGDKDVIRAFVKTSKRTVRTLILYMQDIINFCSAKEMPVTVQIINSYLAGQH